MPRRAGRPGAAKSRTAPIRASMPVRDFVAMLQTCYWLWSMPRRAGRPGAAMDSANIQRALNLPLNEVSFNEFGGAVDSGAAWLYNKRKPRKTPWQNPCHPWRVLLILGKASYARQRGHLAVPGLHRRIAGSFSGLLRCRQSP